MEKQFVKRAALTLTALLGFIAPILAQTNGPAMADTMRANGKIYVVVAVLAIIFVGIVVYLISIDRKTTKLENEMKLLKD